MENYLIKENDDSSYYGNKKGAFKHLINISSSWNKSIKEKQKKSDLNKWKQKIIKLWAEE